MAIRTAPSRADLVARCWLAPLAGLTAVSAMAGAVGLATGAVDLGADAADRLPRRSLPFAAVALAVVVGLPMAVAAFLAGRGHPGRGIAAVLAGVLLVGWILVEVAIIRELSWLQVLFAAVGLVAQDGAPPYRVRWTDDDRTTLVFPGPGARVLDEHQLAEFDGAHAKRAFSRGARAGRPPPGPPSSPGRRS